MEENYFDALKKILEKDKRYTWEAYYFLWRALAYTQKRLDRRGHVTGRELLEGIKELALERFGPMAKRVFESWGVHSTDDWGEIVFALVNAEVLGKTADDSKEDFKGVYDFEEVFVKGYKYQLEQERKD